MQRLSPGRALTSACLLLGLACLSLSTTAAGSPAPPPPTSPSVPPPTLATLPVTDEPIATLPPTDLVTTSTTTTTTTTTTASTTSTTVPAIPAEVWERFDRVIAERLVGRGDRAAGVAVSLDGVALHAATFGTRAPTGGLDGGPDPAVVTDRFRIASISKLLTATVVLQLVAEGQLSLDEPVGDQIAAAVGAPYHDPRWAGVTIRQLLSHTAGVPKYRGEFFGGTFDTCEGAATYGLSHPLSGPVGTHVYSNLNFCLLGLLIGHITGRPYEQAVTDLLLAPLGITGMRTVATIDPDPDEIVHVDASDRTYMQALGGAGAWVGTPADLVRIVDSLDPNAPGWHPLPPHLATLMHVPDPNAVFPEPWTRTFGLGTIVWPDGSFGHTGTVERSHGMVARRPDGLTWCILVAGDVPESTEALADVFAEALAESGLDLASLREELPAPSSPDSTPAAT